MKACTQLCCGVGLPAGKKVYNLENKKVTLNIVYVGGNEVVFKVQSIKPQQSDWLEHVVRMKIGS